MALTPYECVITGFLNLQKSCLADTIHQILLRTKAKSSDKVKYKVKTCQNFKMYIEFYLPTL